MAINIYLDDLRETLAGYKRTYTVEETIELLKKYPVGKLSLDNDLGPGEEEGYKVVDWIEEQFFTNPKFKLPNEIRVHSMNSMARKRMQTIIDRLYNK